jgi:acetylglutamate kinase
MVLAGSINKEIVGWIAGAGGRAVGISGKDAGLVICEKVGDKRAPDPNSGIERNVDLGFVGDPVKVDRRILDTLSKDGIIPVIAPVGIGIDGETYNVNADTMAGAIAAELKAKRFFLLTDVPGVLSKEKDLLSDLKPSDIGGLIADGTISGGMIPKVETCVKAVEGGVDAAVISTGASPMSCCSKSSPSGAQARWSAPKMTPRPRMGRGWRTLLSPATAPISDMLAQVY